MGANLLALAGFMSLAVAAFHVVAAFEPRLQANFGAPERLIAAGPLAIGAAALALAAVFAAWGAYGFSGAGWLPRLPLLSVALVAIGAVYFLRGLLLGPQLLAATGRLRRKIPTDPQRVASSAVSLAIGVVYLAGTATAWSQLV